MGGLTRRNILAGMVGAGLAPMPSAVAQGRRWIDVHMHVIGGPERQFGEAVKRAVAEMDDRGIAKAVVFPPPFPRRGFDYPAYVPELSRYPGRFGFLAGGGLLNPMLHQFPDPASVTHAIRQEFVGLAERMVDAGAVGFGEISVLHLSLVPNHSFTEVTPEHPLMIALVETAGRRGVVIDLHMDAVTAADTMRTPALLKSPPNPRTLMGNIAGFERLLAHDRNARIVWAHGGSDYTGNMTPALIGRLMDVHSNLYMSLRPVQPGRTVLPAFGLRLHNTLMPGSGVDKAWLDLLKRHSDRFVLGADAFFVAQSAPPDSPLRTLARGNEMRLGAVGELLSRLPAALVGKIAQENAVRLYRL
jgi:hypothetical protein